MMRIDIFFFLGLISFSAAGQQRDVVYKLDSLYNVGDYQGSLALEKEVVLFIGEREDTVAANSAWFIGDSYRQIDNPEKALPWLRREVAIRKKLIASDPAGYSSSLYALTQFYIESGNYPNALETGKLMLAFDQGTFGKKSETAVYSLLLFAEVLIATDRLAEAQTELTNGLSMAPSPLRGLVKGKLAYLLGYRGLNSRASRMFQEALVEIKLHRGISSEEYQVTLANYGYLLLLQGRYDLAEEELSSTLSAIRSSGSTGNNDTYYATLNNLSIAYKALGQFASAEHAYAEILRNDSLTLGVKHPDYAVTLSNLGLLYVDEKRFTDAERVLLQSLEVTKESGLLGTVSHAKKLNNLAKVYLKSGVPQKCIPLLEQSLAIFGKRSGKKSREYATVMFNLGVAHLQANNEQSYGYLRKAAALRKESLGTNHPLYAECLEQIAIYKWRQKKVKEAQSLFQIMFRNYYGQIDNYFPVLTEEEKSNFYFSRIKPSNEIFTTWALEAHAATGSSLAELYSIQLNTKGLILFATDKLRRQILNSGDSSLVQLFEKWEAQKELLAYHFGQNHTSPVIDSLMLSSGKLEKELSRRSSDFTREIIRPKVTWLDVQKALAPDEAAIEIVRYQEYNKDAARPGHRIMYAALILTSKTTQGPVLVMIPDGDKLESRSLKYYSNSIQFQLEDDLSYTAYWQPIQNKLSELGISKVAISTDGVYHQVALNSLFNPATKKYLVEELIIKTVTSTRDILQPRTSSRKGQGYLLFGFPTFSVNHDSTTTTTTRNAVAVSRSIRGSLSRFLRGDAGISALPGTQSEVRDIERILIDEKPAVYLETDANELQIKTMRSPSVVHVATHGFFFDNEVHPGIRPPNPLLNSGLILAGAGNFISTGYNPVHPGEDGILTAYEAMNLDLEGTEAIILSACETGLGKRQNGEGVYGLQRAFSLAGAHNVVMSLWSVDDQATRELMALFYRNWTATKDIHTSFRQAQLELMKKRNAPYYWAAFVVVGK